MCETTPRGSNHLVQFSHPYQLRATPSAVAQYAVTPSAVTQSAVTEGPMMLVTQTRAVTAHHAWVRQLPSLPLPLPVPPPKYLQYSSMSVSMASSCSSTAGSGTPLSARAWGSR